MKYTETEIDDIATDIAVMRGSQERRDAIKKLIADLQTEPANIFSSNAVLADSLPLSELPKLFEWIKEREIDLDGSVWEEFVGHDTPNEYTTEELIEEWRKR